VGVHSCRTICYSIVGTLEAVLKWGTGRDFAVREVKCSARRRCGVRLRDRQNNRCMSKSLNRTAAAFLLAFFVLALALGRWSIAPRSRRA